MRPRVLRFKRVQTYWMPAAAAEVWEPVETALQLQHRLQLALESLEGCRRITPIRCAILAMIGRQSGLGITAGRLARELRLPRATLSHHLKALGRQRLIDYGRHEMYDRRKALIVLTERGAQALERAAEILIELTATDGSWPEKAHLRHYWNLRRVPREWMQVPWREVEFYLGPRVVPPNAEGPPDWLTRARDAGTRVAARWRAFQAMREARRNRPRKPRRRRR